MSPSSEAAGVEGNVDQLLLAVVGVAPGEASAADLMQATARLARRELSQRWVQTQAAERADKARRVYYLSMEFLIGRTLTNALAALGLREDAAAALHAQVVGERIVIIYDQYHKRLAGNLPQLCGFGNRIHFRFRRVLNSSNCGSRKKS